MRVHFTRFWTLARGSGCVARAPSGWTSVTARAAGTVVVVARFSIARALGLGGSCRAAHPPEAPLGCRRRMGLSANTRALVFATAHVPGDRGGVRQGRRGDRAVAPSRAEPSAERPGSRGGARAHGTPALSLAGSHRRATTVDRGREPRARHHAHGGCPGPRSLLGGEARGPVEGYVAEQAIAAGQIQTVYVNAPGARTVTVQVYRMGWYGGTGGRLVLRRAGTCRRSHQRAVHAPLL